MNEDEIWDEICSRYQMIYGTETDEWEQRMKEDLMAIMRKDILQKVGLDENSLMNSGGGICK